MPFQCFRGRPHSATSSAAEQEDDTIIKSLSFINDEHLKLHQVQVSWYRRVSTVAQRRPNPSYQNGAEHTHYFHCVFIKIPLLFYNRFLLIYQLIHFHNPFDGGDSNRH